MATAPAGLRLRPLPLSELFDEVFRLYRRRFTLLWVSAVFATIPSAIFTGVGVAVLAGFGLFTQSQPQISGPPNGPGLISAGIGLLIALALTPLAAFLPWRAALAAVLGEPLSVGGLLQATMSSYGRLWLLTLGFGGLLVLAALPALTCVGVVLTVWLYVRWSVTVPAWFAEGRRVRPSLARSAALVEGNWWRIFGILFLFTILSEVVGGALSSFTIVAAFVPPDWLVVATIARLVVDLFLNTLVAPLFPLVATLLYFDLRVRHEHLDLQVMARRLRGETSLWPPAPEPYPPPPPLPPGMPPAAPPA